MNTQNFYGKYQNKRFSQIALLFFTLSILSRLAASAETVPAQAIWVDKDCNGVNCKQYGTAAEVCASYRSDPFYEGSKLNNIEIDGSVATCKFSDISGGPNAYRQINCPENSNSVETNSKQPQCECISGFKASGGQCVDATASTITSSDSIECPQRNEEEDRDALGGVVIRSELQAPAGRREGFENQLFRGIQVGLPGWQRAHSQGQGTGNESERGILYAPEEVNQSYQNSKIEKYLRELFKAKPSDQKLCLTTVTYAHARSLRLKEIQYRVEAIKQGTTPRILFEASIEVENRRDNPKVSVQAKPSGM